MEPIAIYITLALLFGFFVESIFGFAGTVISFAILGIFVDIKILVPLILYVATAASICVIITDRHSLSKKEYIEMAKLAIPGAIIGVVLFNHLSSEILLKILALLLVAQAVQSFFEPKLSESCKNLLLFISGIIHGVFGLGGIVAIGTMKDRFAHKSQLRVTFAAFFITLNAVRAVQYQLQGSLELSEIVKFWWMPLPLFFVIWLGHRVHLKISENVFKKGISTLLLASGIFMLLG